MRINQLDLTRFGNFTDVTLDLSNPGLQLVIGRNEAGKTTAMAAIRQLLFGIPVRTTHDFVHDMRDLTIGATVADESGDELEIVRVKRRNDTLRNPQDDVLEEGLLTKLLHDTAADVYASLFTIGHDEISAGGETLLNSDGEVGRALFSASRGTTDLTAVMRALDARTSELFTSRGSTRSLNVDIRSFKDASAEAKAKSSSATEVLGLDDKLSTAQLDHDRLQRERRELAGRKSLLAQIRSSRPQLATRRDAIDKKEAIEQQGPLVDLAIKTQLDDARSRRAAAETARRGAKATIERLDDKLEGLIADTTLLDQREAIDQLQTDTGGYELNCKDIPKLDAKAATFELEIAELVRSLPEGASPDEPGHTKLSVDRRRRIEEAADLRVKLDGELDHLGKALDETRALLQGLRSELAELGEAPDVSTLADTAIRIRKDGDLETKHAAVVRRLETEDADLSAELASLGLGDVDLRAVDAIEVPSLETIRRHRTDFDQLRGDIERLESQIQVCRADIDTASDELDALLETQQPPARDELDTARTHRNEGWRLIKAAWLDEVDDADQAAAIETWSGGAPLADAYEGAVEQADDVADRLRRDASAVEQRAVLEGRISELQESLKTQSAELNSMLHDRDAAVAAWSGLWSPLGIEPDSRPAMEEWHARFASCATRAAEQRKLSGEVTELADAIARHRADLLESLARVGPRPASAVSLLGLLDQADQVVAAAGATQQQRTAITKSIKSNETQLATRTADLDRSVQAMASWEAQWADAVSAIGLDATASPSEARIVLETLREIESNSHELHDIRGRRAGINARIAEFTDGLAAVLAALDGYDELVDADPAAATKTLSRLLKQALDIESMAKATTEEREANATELATSELALEEASAVISELVQSSGVTDEAALDEAISRSDRHAELIAEIEAVEEDLRQATGKPMSQVESEAATCDGVEIGSEIEELDGKIEAIDELIEAKASTVGELRNQRSMIDSSGEAADAMTRAQQALASLADHADEYVRVVLARKLLEEQVAAYRSERQGPLLRRARELFGELTVGRYQGLDTDSNDKGEPVLRARAADGKHREIAHLSTGTRDQLYLALRLAALEQFIDRRGPLPLVLDDLFVHFDDERTEAGLATLDEFAAKTQILLFTHHEQVATQAAHVIDTERLSVHRIA